MVVELEKIRYPVASGVIYPSDEYILEDIIEEAKNKTKNKMYHGDIFGLIVPADEYNLSGKCAASAYKLIAEKDIERVFLLGDFEKGNNDGIVMDNTDFWRTPLGEVEICQDTVEKLESVSENVIIDKSKHLEEQLLEIQLPFLQFFLDNEFKIVPILCGNRVEDEYELFAGRMAKIYDYNKDIIIIVSNLESGKPSYQAVEPHKKAVDVIETGDYTLIEEKLFNKEVIVSSPHSILLGYQTSIILGAQRIEVFDTYHSGEVNAKHKSVIGYFSAAMVK